jgi:uncharacterized protein YjlB
VHHSIFNEYQVLTLIELPDGDNIGGEAWQDVDIGEDLVLTILAEVGHGAKTLS